MIKINLVPLKEKKKQQEYIFILFGGLVAIVLASGMFWFYIQKIEAKRDLTVKIKKVEDESKGYEEKIAEVTTFEQTQATLDGVLKTIKDIQLVQRKSVFVLDQVALNLPNGISITAITQGVGKDPAAFAIDGFAFSLSAVKDYFNVLSKVDGLSRDASLELKNISASAAGNKQVIQFEIVTKATDPTL